MFRPKIARVRCCSRKCGAAQRVKRYGSPMKGRKLSAEAKEKMAAAKRGNGGPAHWNYRHGRSRYAKDRKWSPEHRAWREQVFARDDFTCHGCGQHGGYLEAHHVKSWAEHPDLRFELENGMTVCVPCHCEIDPHRAKFVKAGGSDF